MAFNEPLSFKAWFIDPLGPLQLNLPPSLSQVLDRLTLETREQVLTHASFDKERNYEDLEYVGDAILQVAATLFLERRYPKLSRGENCTIRTLIVGKTTLSQIFLALGLHTLLRMGSSATPPTQGVMEDVFEALLGGICRDFDLQEAVRWCGEVLGAVWDENEAYFVRDQLVRDRYGIPSPPISSHLRPAQQLSSLASPPASAPPPAPSPLDLPSRRTTTGVDHSKSELTRVCSALHLSLDYEPVSSTKMPEGGFVWVERVKVGDGKFVAEGTGWTMKSAQSAAASNVLKRRELQGVPKLKRRRVK